MTTFRIISICIFTILFSVSCENSQTKLKNQREIHDAKVRTQIVPLSNYVKRNGPSFTAGMFLTNKKDLFTEHSSKVHNLLDFHKNILAPNLLSSASLSETIYPIIAITGISKSSKEKPHVLIALTIENSTTGNRIKIKEYPYRNDMITWSDDILDLALVGPLPGITVAEVNTNSYGVAIKEVAKDSKFRVQAIIKDTVTERVITLEQSLQITS